MQKKRIFIVWLLIVVFVLLTAAVGWYYHLMPDHQENKNHQDRAIQVVLADAHTADVPVYLSALGTVTAANSVTVRTQINGHLLKVLFNEGQMVKTGDVLAEIDSQPYQAQLMQFQGQLSRDEALLANAQRDLKRYKAVYPQGGVSQQTYDTQISLVKQLEGTVKADQGQVAGAQINLNYCQIKSPIEGRVGLRHVDPGNFVQISDSNGLAVINTIQPITILFSIPEDKVPQLMQQVSSGKELIVEAFDRSQNKLLAIGKLLTLDNQIDVATGTIKLKALFKNQDDRLFPNQFVNVKLLMDTLHGATLIPTAAIQQGAKGSFVYVANKDSTVSLKPVVAGVTIGDNSTVTGVVIGQKVVVEGADKLIDGAKTAS
jgi:multidrug efflux system membrane fusion protein